jgi:hypothetical protein
MRLVQCKRYSVANLLTFDQFLIAQQADPLKQIRVSNDPSKCSRRPREFHTKLKSVLPFRKKVRQIDFRDSDIRDCLSSASTAPTFFPPL